jgi:APA family basic amino acid/polyamine antiporter
VVLSFIIAGSVALLTGLSTAELSSFIHEAGGSYIYTTKAFGKFPGFVVGWMNSFDYIVGASAVSVGFAAYFAYFLNIPAGQATLVVVGSVWPIILMLLNLKGTKEAAGTNNLLVALKISALIVFIMVCAITLFDRGDFSNYPALLPRGGLGRHGRCGRDLLRFHRVQYDSGDGRGDKRSWQERSPSHPHRLRGLHPDLHRCCRHGGGGG